MCTEFYYKVATKRKRCANGARENSQISFRRGMRVTVDRGAVVSRRGLDG